MKPDDIINTGFGKALNGYNKSDVDKHLVYVRKEYENLVREYDYLKLKLTTKESEIKTLRDNESAIKDAILTAQKASDEMKDTANKEGLKLINEAKMEAESIIEEARKEADKIRNDQGVLVDSLKEEYNEIKDAKEALQEEYKEFLVNYKKLLNEQLNKFDF